MYWNIIATPGIKTASRVLTYLTFSYTAVRTRSEETVFFDVLARALALLFMVLLVSECGSAIMAAPNGSTHITHKLSRLRSAGRHLSSPCTHVLILVLINSLLSYISPDTWCRGPAHLLAPRGAIGRIP